MKVLLHWFCAQRCGLKGMTQAEQIKAISFLLGMSSKQILATRNQSVRANTCKTDQEQINIDSEKWLIYMQGRKWNKGKEIR